MKDKTKSVNFQLVGTIINGVKIIDYFLVPVSRKNKATKHSRSYFKCICKCGKEFVARTESIKNETTNNCGCDTINLMISSHTLPNNMGAIKNRYSNYKNTACRKNLDFSISLDCFVKLIFENCAYCGSEPIEHKFLGSNKKYKYLTHNGIDRVDNAIGYTEDNCVTCCYFCNRAKSDESVEDFKKWIQRIISYNEKSKD